MPLALVKLLMPFALASRMPYSPSPHAVATWSLSSRGAIRAIAATSAQKMSDETDHATVCETTRDNDVSRDGFDAYWCMPYRPLAPL